LLAAALAGMPALAADRELKGKAPTIEGVPDFIDLHPIVLSVIDPRPAPPRAALAPVASGRLFWHVPRAFRGGTFATKDWKR
jgi:hypothetical protein